MNCSLKPAITSRRRACAGCIATIFGGLLLLWLLSVRHDDDALHSLLVAGNAPIWLLGGATGLLAGFLFGLLGIGGALVVMPVLYLMLPALGVPAAEVPHVAVATSLMVMLPAALRGSWRHYRLGGLERAWLVRLAPGVLFGAAVGALLAQQLPGTALSLLFVVQSIYYGWGLMKAVPPRPDSGRARIAARCKALPAWSVGPLAGGFCACVGMGGGSMLVPYLLANGVGMLRAAATSGALNLSIALGGAVAFAALQLAPTQAAPVCWPAAWVIGLAGVLAVPLGVAAGPRVSPIVFRRLLGGVNLLGAAALLMRTLWV